MATEADIAKKAIAWLESQGWECYQEVPVASGRADIVAVRMSLVWIVETKIALTPELVMQCRERMRERVSGVMACFPASRRKFHQSHPLVDWNRWHGIGSMTVEPDANIATVINWPVLRRIPTELFLRELHPEMKTQSVAGTSGQYWTPFKNLVKQLQDNLRHGWTLREAAENLTCLNEYQQRRISAQCRALTDYLDRKLIPGWRLDRSSGKCVIAKIEEASNG